MTVFSHSARLYIARDVSESVVFKPQTRKEISVRIWLLLWWLMGEWGPVGCDGGGDMRVLLGCSSRCLCMGVLGVMCLCLWCPLSFAIMYPLPRPSLVTHSLTMTQFSSRA